MSRKFFLIILCLSVFAIDADAVRKGPWTREQAWEWYNKQPWIRGCNYMSADCANRVDQWQKLGFEERLKTQEAELSLAESIGFNTLRLIIAEEGFGVWYADRKGFMKRFEQTLQLCEKHGMRAIVLLGNDCSRPKQLWKLPKPGKQTYDWGYHGGRKQSQHGSFPGAIGYTCMDDPKLAPKFYEMCREIITRYKDDDRILFWNLWNEPGNNGRGALTDVNMPKLFEIAWEIDPKQPLAADVWYRWGQDNLSGDLSDIISYHLYRPLETQQAIVEDLKARYGRPLINTEWMARILGCNIDDTYPYFEQERIGCTMWGFVAGKYQTYEPWEGMWKRIENGEGQEYEMTKWFHDLYRPSHRPYDPKEIEIIRNVNHQADIEDGLAEGMTLRSRTVSSYADVRQDMWHGFRRISFPFMGCMVRIVEPSVAPAVNMPWTWLLGPGEEFVDRMGVTELLAKGWHHVALEPGDSADMEQVMESLQKFLSGEAGFSGKASLVGVGRGGRTAVSYAAAHSACVANMYLDGPEVSGMSGEASAIASVGIPVLVMYGSEDTEVVPDVNCLPFAEAVSQAGGQVTVVERSLFGHHPYGTEPDKLTTITSFIAG